MFSNRKNSQQETTCHLLLKELQIIWDEVGESDSQRDAMLLEIEQKCLDLYRSKVDEAKLYRAQIQQEITDYVGEIAGICAALGEQSPHFDPKSCGSLKKAREKVVSQLEEMRKLKTEKKKQFAEVLYQLKNISIELHGSKVVNDHLDENNLSLKRLQELKKQLLQLQNEKANRLKQVSDQLNTLNSLCSVLGLDVKDKICDIFPTMVNSSLRKDVSDNTIKNLTSEIQSLREIKIHRMQKLQSLAASLLEMWDLMDTPLEEQQKFLHVTSKIAALESEFTESKILSIDSVIYVEKEVERLQELKSTKMKELLLKKKLELEEICRKTHLTPQTVFPGQHSLKLLDYDQIQHLITKANEEALGRKEILEKVEKWMAACQEESWLEEYNRDDNRYNAGRGAHLALKRAEKARALLSKIPGLVEAIILKVKAWEKERGQEFLYDGSRLLSMLEDYSILRQEKENERQRQRDQKKLQGQLMTEHETLFGTKPSPSSKSGYKAPRCSTGIPSIRKFSVGGAMLQDQRHASLIHQSNKKGIITNHKGSILRNKNIYHSTQSSVKSGSSAEKSIEILSSLTRKPLSPLSPAALSSSNISNLQQDLSKLQNVATQQKSQILTATTSPSRAYIAGAEENMTPKNMTLPVPTTPLTSVPMLTSTTPDTVYSGATASSKTTQSFEYSFEEVRAGFILPKTHAQ
ncbi:65-kDa microtubule-associated protein 3-like isoform X2 [Vigna unguiculata]|uniref:65-kDa microtubule-associated protein 3-like isoform X2 n=1 Tax=Vigna unguiculata TaxID=3917 RepID=UPI0010168F1C|nr:65-kDa microtubule-associated protein 3-like isoform X2 [Vigna unguiculata]